VVADLTPLHQARLKDPTLADDPTVHNAFSGQHSDIYVDEIYELLALFLGS
jgi:hypothetical protein